MTDTGIIEYVADGDVTRLATSMAECGNDERKWSRLLQEAYEVRDALSASWKGRARQDGIVAITYKRLYDGGGEKSVCSLANALADDGKVLLIARDGRHYPLGDDVSVEVTPSITDADTARSRMDGTERALRDHDVKTLLIETAPPSDMIPELLACYRTGVTPVLVTNGMFAYDLTYGDDLTDRKYRFVINGLMATLCHVTIASTYVDAVWYRFLGINDVRVIPPITTETAVRLFYGTPTTLSGRRVGYSARIDHNKNTLDAIKAFRLIHDEMPDVTMDVYGASSLDSSNRWYRQQVFDYVKENGLEGVITFHGIIDDMVMAYHKMDVMLATSRNEGYGYSMLECLCAGVPLVVSRLQNTPFANGTFTSQDMVFVTDSIEEMAGDAIRVLKAERNGMSVARRQRTKITLRKLTSGLAWQDNVTNINGSHDTGVSSLSPDGELLFSSLLSGWSEDANR